MSAWLTESEFRNSGAKSAGVTINVAFLKEIKTDFAFRDELNRVYHQLNQKSRSKLTPQQASDLLADLRDALETYFALEEFYGYFKASAIKNPSVNRKADDLQSAHESLYNEIDAIVEKSLQIVYHEVNESVTLDDLITDLDQFCVHLADHEAAEMDLMMRLWNEDIGVGG